MVNGFNDAVRTRRRHDREFTWKNRQNNLFVCRLELDLTDQTGVLFTCVTSCSEVASLPRRERILFTEHNLYGVQSNAGLHEVPHCVKNGRRCSRPYLVIMKEHCGTISCSWLCESSLTCWDLTQMYFHIKFLSLRLKTSVNHFSEH